MSLDHPALLEVSLHPISDAASAGEDPFATEEFHSLSARLKAARLNPEKANWRELVQAAEDILAGHGKDLRTAIYLIEALSREEGFDGMAIGLRILQDLVETFGNELHPRRERARQNAISAMGDTLQGLLEIDVSSPENLEALHDCLMHVTALEAALPEALGDPQLASPLVRIRKRLTELTRAHKPKEPNPTPERQTEPPRTKVATSADRPVTEGVQQQEAAPEPARAETSVKPALAEQRQPGPQTPPHDATAAPASAPAIPLPSFGPLPGGAITPADTSKAISQVKTTMGDLAKALRQADPSDSRAYALVRHALWFSVVNEPLLFDQTSGLGGRTTAIPAPDAGELAAAKRRLAGTSDPLALVDIVNRLEMLVPDSPFWLDPHWVVAQALAQLGETYAAARKTVTITSAGFVQRLPGVLHLEFLGGQPFADSETRAWIENSIPVAGKTGSNWAVAASALADTEAKARKLANEDRAREGLLLFVGGRRVLGSERERFEWDLAQAKYCRECGFRGVALSLLENLEGRVTERRLEDWEPAWVIEHAVALLGLYNGEQVEAGAAHANPERRDAFRRVFGRLSRLDPAAACGFADLAT